MSGVAISDAERHCARIVRASGSSFAATFWMFPSEQRRALHAVYAFCRLADDIADDPDVGSDRRLLLHRWRAELDAAYAGSAVHPVGVALAAAVRRHALPRRCFDDLLRGIELDLDARPLARFADVEEYCYCVAGTVGLLVVALLGERSPAVERYAVEQGIAVQLTNILRDVGPDARAGRIYLAREDLERFGVAARDLASERPTERLRDLLRSYAERAGAGYDRARALLPGSSRRALRPALAMGAIYRDLLERIRARDFASLEEPVRSPKARRVALAAGAWLRPGAPA